MPLTAAIIGSLWFGESLFRDGVTSGKISSGALPRHPFETKEDSMLHMIGHAIFGLIIGLLARAVMPGRQHMGLILTMILGIVGAWLGGLIGRMTGMYKEGHPAGFIMALIGALIVLFLYSLAVQ